MDLEGLPPENHQLDPLAEQFAWLRKALANQRRVDRILGKMRRLSKRIVVEHLPAPPRRKSLSIKPLHPN